MNVEQFVPSSHIYYSCSPHGTEDTSIAMHLRAVPTIWYSVRYVLYFSMTRIPQIIKNVRDSREDRSTIAKISESQFPSLWHAHKDEEMPVHRLNSPHVPVLRRFYCIYPGFIAGTLWKEPICHSAMLLSLLSLVKRIATRRYSFIRFSSPEYFFRISPPLFSMLSTFSFALRHSKD